MSDDELLAKLRQVENRPHVLEWLQLLDEETGKDGEAERVREEIQRSREPKTTTTVRFARDSVQVRQSYDFGGEERPLEDLPNLTRMIHPCSVVSSKHRYIGGSAFAEGLLSIAECDFTQGLFALTHQAPTRN